MEEEGDREEEEEEIIENEEKKDSSSFKLKIPSPLLRGWLQVCRAESAALHFEV